MRFDLALLLEEAEYAWERRPGGNVDACAGPLWKGAWDVVDEPAAGDVCEALEEAGTDSGKEGLDVEPCRFQEGFAEGLRRC